MFHWYNALLVESRRREKEIAEASMSRLLKEAHAESVLRVKKHYPWLARRLASLGSLLVAWGCRLQSRYDTLSIPNLTPPNLAAQAPEGNPEPCSS